MELVAVNCNRCGASLDVGPGTNFVTCAHCGVRLAVKRTASSSYTELLESIDRKTDTIAARLDDITRQDELDRIDREWEQVRQNYVRKDQHGKEYEPNVTAGAFAAVAFAMFGLLLIGLSFLVAPVLGALGLLLLGGAVGIWLWERDRAERFELAEARYRSRREAARIGAAAAGGTNRPSR